MCFLRHLICRRQIHPLPELLVGGLARQRITCRKRGFHHQRPALGGGQMRQRGLQQNPLRLPAPSELISPPSAGAGCRSW